MKTRLLYIGDGTALHDVPARDLNEDEAAYYGVDRLLSSGLYKTPELPKPAAKPAPKEDQADHEEGD